MARSSKQRKSQKKLSKSVMSRVGPLTMAQRIDYQYLVNSGIPLDEARAIAQSYAVAKEDKEAVDKKDTTQAYYQAFHAASKRLLPDWQHMLLHRTARGKAGAEGLKATRMRTDTVKAELLDEMEMLRKRIKECQEEVSKSGPLASEVHVPVPLGSENKQKKIVTKREMALSAQEMAYIQAAYNLAPPVMAPSPDAEAAPEQPSDLMQANRLVAGMDAEMAAGAQDAAEARIRASRTLRERPGLYDAVGVEPEVRALRGLMIDIGSGQNRAMGYLGLDIFAYDYGTVLHDVEMGLPFPDGSVRSIRLHSSLHTIIDGPGGSGDPMPLLRECQRVLMEGGRIYYVGPEPLFEEGQTWPLPGLVLVRNTSRAHSDGYEQQLERVPLRVPAYHGAEAIFAPAAPMPVEVQMALQAYNAAPAQSAMANLIHKADVHTPGTGKGAMPEGVRLSLNRYVSGKKLVPIAKADKWRQIVYGVVLSPDEIDTQGDTMSAEEIEKSAHGWMATSRIIGSEHGKPIDAVPVESFIAPVEIKGNELKGIEPIKQGAWVMGVKINDPHEWQQVLDGEYTGFSVGGLGLRD